MMLALAADAGDKKVPPRHPKNRLKTLRRFALEWLADNFKNYSDEEKAAKAGERIFNRFAPRFDESLNDSGKPLWGGRLAALVNDECFFYDPNTTHGGRARRQVSDEEGGDQDYDDSRAADDMIRYDKNNPVRGLKQITTGFRKWAQRYINECAGEDGKSGKGQKNHSKRANNLNKKIKARLQKYLDKFGDE